MKLVRYRQILKKIFKKAPWPEKNQSQAQISSKTTYNLKPSVTVEKQAAWILDYNANTKQNVILKAYVVSLKRKYHSYGYCQAETTDHLQTNWALYNSRHKCKKFSKKDDVSSITTSKKRIEAVIKLRNLLIHFLVDSWLDSKTYKILLCGPPTPLYWSNGQTCTRHRTRALFKKLKTRTYFNLSINSLYRYFNSIDL